MSTLLIRLPARATLDSAAAVAMPDCRYALVSDAGRIERQGVEQLAGLAEPIAAATRVVLILAAADVNLLQLQVPPLSDSKLKMALPNLVEEQLLVDPFDCVIVAGRKRPGAVAAANNLRLIAVVQRDWLELLVKTLLTLGAHNLQAWPAQLCLPLREPEMAVAAITDHGGDIDVALHVSAEQGMGWSLSPVSGQSVAQEVLEGLTAILPQQQITLYVPQSSLAAYQELEPAQITVLADDWSHWLAGTQELASARSGIDLMSGLTASAAGTEFSWRRWRWPLGLAAALLLVNIVSVNYDWLRMRREAAGLRSGMMQNYRAAFPKETVIVDPIAQARQKIAVAQRDGGQLAADDFLSLATAFGTAWAGLPQSSDSGAIASLDYRDHHLLVRLKNPGDADGAETQIKSALASMKLTLSKPTTGVWQIGSGK
ncbi:MAG: type II secretion system protein GspL [Collimonas sp.]|uniref:type II secretion system protein GspL n=1 Tax=Collimonas sp. TaxID=1963772 RepID=UPI0032673621